MTADEKRKAGKYKRHRDWIAGEPCAVQDDNCAGRVEAAHVRMGNLAGMGKKPHDKWCVPLCQFHHDARVGGKLSQHGRGEISFWGERGIDPKALALSYAARSPFLPREEEVA